MKEHIMFLKIAKSEIETLIDYTEMLGEEESLGGEIVDEIMGDEFNHALISMITAAKLMGVKIATDDVKPDPNDIEVKEGE